MSKEERKLFNLIVKNGKPKNLHEQQFLENYFEEVKKQFTSTEIVPDV